MSRPKPIKRILNKLRIITSCIRSRLGAELHHWLTMPDYYYIDEGEPIKRNDQIRIGIYETWHDINNLIGEINPCKGFIRRPKKGEII